MTNKSKKDSNWLSAGLVKLSSFFYTNWQFSLVVWLALLAGGATVYTQLIPKEGFPSIQFPLSTINGTYFVDDPEVVDADITSKITVALEDLDYVKETQSLSGDNFFNVVVFYESDQVPVEANQKVQDYIGSLDILPESVEAEYQSIDVSGFLNDFDTLISVYKTTDTSPEALDFVANAVAAELEADPEITNVQPQNLITTSVNQQTGQEESRQTAFNKIGLQEDGQFNFYNSQVIGLDVAGDLDVIDFSEYLSAKLQTLDLDQYGEGYEVAISAEYAESINTQISALESNLSTGLLAVAIISFLLISWRASIVTGLFMVTVMAVTVSVLYLLGYTLNTITLFALVLSLGLFVDDATIVVESLDSAARRRKKGLAAVQDSIKRVASASFAGTLTTVLVFAPLAFISGILGEFIRIMPVTVIIALVSSLLLSLTIIPFLSRFLILDKEVDALTKNNPLRKLEEKISTILSNNIRKLAKDSGKRSQGIGIALTSISISIVMVVIGVITFSKISLNIFPPSKDSDQINYSFSFPEDYSIEQAEDVSDQLDKVAVDILGENVSRITYGATQSQASNRGADANVELISFKERDITSVQFIEQLEAAFEAAAPEGVTSRIVQIDAGPPIDDFPLQVQIFDEDPQLAAQLAEEVRQYIEGATIEVASGSSATIIDTQAPRQSSILRYDNRRALVVGGAFDSDDVSALLQSSQTYLEDKFTEEYLTANGYQADALGFDFGQESDNADSFSSLAIVFPVVLLMMFILLAVQFKSLLQPALIFLAIPFTIFGVASGLYATDNALSFFVQVGYIGLIGIAVNNTILLTDYANQEKRNGYSPIEAVARAAQARFRPLVTTSITTVVALLPLALSDPFWEALSVTIVAGLLSSTFLVILAYPYYYLGAEFMVKGAKKLIGRS